jgi:mannose-6-phosphate isomerase-like protein (cupin superfamily)
MVVRLSQEADVEQRSAEQRSAEQKIVEDPVLKQRLAFRPSDDADDALMVEMWVEPGGGVPPHMHPAMEERFEILSGELSLLAGRKWATAGPGETVVVPARTRHAYRNTGSEVAHAICRAAPGQTLQEFLEEAAAMARAGRLTRNGLPRSPRAAAQALSLAVRHRKMVIMRWL